MLFEDKGWSASEVNDLWEHSVNSPVLLGRKVPVHLTYFTTVVDDSGNVTSFADIYGLDKKLAMALFGNTTAACSIWTRNEETATRGKCISIAFTQSWQGRDRGSYLVR